jgi:hypothetical protein
VQWSLLRHPGVAQASEEGGFEQRADLRRSQVGSGSHTGEARIGAVAAQLLGFREFGRCALALAFEAIGGGEVSVWICY